MLKRIRGEHLQFLQFIVNQLLDADFWFSYVYFKTSSLIKLEYLDLLWLTFPNVRFS